jgi:hypothetical protein
MSTVFRLCYIDPRRPNCAWFTTAPITGPQRQWGDDWNDAPYEHNSEPPYEWAAYMRTPEYHLERLYFEVDGEQPCDRSFNSPWSVEQINVGRVPWLILSDVKREAALDHDGHTIIEDDPSVIMGGETIDGFKRKVKAAGGLIFTREP